MWLLLVCQGDLIEKCFQVCKSFEIWMNAWKDALLIPHLN
jgi:hypothetical protein